MKVGRNDPCPCNSGKKHKHCCLNKTNTISIPWQIHEENEVLSNLLSDETFNRYYSKYRLQISKNILWVNDPKLPEGIDYRKSVHTSGVNIIRLRNIKPNVTESSKIAHEIHHVYLDCLGYPSIKSNDTKYENIAASLSSMLLDLIIEETLYLDGFNIRNDYENEMKIKQCQIIKLR